MGGGGLGEDGPGPLPGLLLADDTLAQVGLGQQARGISGDVTHEVRHLRRAPRCDDEVDRRPDLRALVRGGRLRYDRALGLARFLPAHAAQRQLGCGETADGRLLVVSDQVRGADPRRLGDVEVDGGARLHPRAGPRRLRQHAALGHPRLHPPRGAHVQAAGLEDAPRFRLVAPDEIRHHDRGEADVVDADPTSGVGRCIDDPDSTLASCEPRHVPRDPLHRVGAVAGRVQHARLAPVLVDHDELDPRCEGSPAADQEVQGSARKLEGLRLERALRGVSRRAPLERVGAAPEASEAADPVLALVPGRRPDAVFPGGLGGERRTRRPPPA